MWQHNYTPIHGSLLLSSLVAALPIFVLLFLLGIRRTPAWIAAISGLGTTVLVSFVLYGMPVERIVSAAAYGAAYGLFPIGWIVIWAVFEKVSVAAEAGALATAATATRPATTSSTSFGYAGRTFRIGAAR